VDDLLKTLTRFHREVVLPDIERIVSSPVGGFEKRLSDEMHALFDPLAARLDRLITAYHSIVVDLQRVDPRLDRIEQRLDKMALGPKSAAGTAD